MADSPAILAGPALSSVAPHDAEGLRWLDAEHQARLVRAEAIRLREREYVLSARAIGLPGHLILWRHILPNSLHILLVQGSLTFVATIKTEVILSFLGLGVKEGVSWGLMLAESTQDVLTGEFGNFLAASSLLFMLLLGVARSLLIHAPAEAPSHHRGDLDEHTKAGLCFLIAFIACGLLSHILLHLWRYQTHR